MAEIRFEIPLSDDSEFAEQQPFDTLLEDVIVFLRTNSVFSVEDLHEHLMRSYPISKSPDEFKEFFEELLGAVEQTLCLRGSDLHLFHDKPRDLYVVILNDHQEETASWDEATDEALAAGVRQELAAIFAQRPVIMFPTLLIYLHHVQGIRRIPNATQPISSRQTINWLVEDGFLGKTSNPDNRDADSYYLPDRAYTTDDAFTDTETRIAEFIIDYLTEEYSLPAGKTMEMMVKKLARLQIGSLEQYSAVVKRLWRRGHIALEKIDKEGVRLYITRSTYRDQSQWSEQRKDVLKRLQQPATLFITDKPPERYQKAAE